MHNNEQISDDDVTWQMINNGFVVDYNLDEVNRFVVESEKKNHDQNSNTLRLVIAPSMSCNYNCVYCFEKNMNTICNSFMSDETIKDTVNFIKHMCKKYKRTKFITIKWFGGEPLLHVDAIEKIIEGMKKEFMQEDDIKFRWQMLITNGRYLTRETAERLCRLGIRKVQIPIDGLPETYAKMKGCTEDDFHAVIENIKNTQDIMNIAIRLNVSNYNKSDVRALVDYLDEQGINAGLYTEWVQEYTDDEAGMTAVDDEYTQIMRDTCVCINEEKQNLKNSPAYPYKSYGCEACEENHFCIAADGGIYRCEHLINNKKYLSGDVKNGLLKKNLDHIWMEPNIPEKCRQCVLLPRCMYKCITDRDIEHIEPRCDFLIKNYIETVKLHRKYTNHQS